MFGIASKAFFHLLAGTPPLRKLASRYGLRRPSSFARRFIAGSTTEEAIDAARSLEARGLMITLDHLGESLSRHTTIPVNRFGRHQAAARVSK